MSSLMRVLFFIGFGIIIGCGNQAKEDRIVLSSQSEDHLVIPEGDYEGFIISKKKTEQAIAKQLGSVLKIYDLSMERKLFLLEGVAATVSLGISTFFDDGPFLVSFNVETTNGKIYTGINCNGLAISNVIDDVVSVIGKITLTECKRDGVVEIDAVLSVQMHKVVISAPPQKTVKIY